MAFGEQHHEFIYSFFIMNHFAWYTNIFVWLRHWESRKAQHTFVVNTGTRKKEITATPTCMK